MFHWMARRRLQPTCVSLRVGTLTCIHRRAKGFAFSVHFDLTLAHLVWMLFLQMLDGLVVPLPEAFAPRPNINVFPTPQVPVQRATPFYQKRWLRLRRGR